MTAQKWAQDNRATEAQIVAKHKALVDAIDATTSPKRRATLFEEYYEFCGDDHQSYWWAMANAEYYSGRYDLTGI